MNPWRRSVLTLAFAILVGSIAFARPPGRASERKRLPPSLTVSSSLSRGHESARVMRLVESGRLGQALDAARKLSAVRDRAAQRERAKRAEVLGLAALAYGELGEAEHAFRSARELLAGSGASAKDLAILDARSSEVATSSGRPDLGLRLAKAAVSVLEKELGPDHPVTLLALIRRGTAHAGLDNRARSRSDLERALRGLEVLTDAPTREIALARFVLRTTTMLDDPAAAEAALHDSATEVEREIGRDHPDVAVIVIMRGFARMIRGDLTGAEQDAARARRILGSAASPRHPATVGARALLATVKYQLADVTGARAECSGALGIAKQRYADTTLMLPPLQICAMIDEHRGALFDAQMGLRQALQIAVAIGMHDRNVAIYEGRLGHVLQLAGDIDGAAEHLKKALRRVEGADGPTHASVATYSQHLGELEFARRNLPAAERAVSRALAIREKLGPKHWMVAVSAKLLGAILCEKGEFSRGRVLIQRAIVILEEAFGTHNAQLGAVLGDAGSCEYAAGETARASELLERALRIFERTYGERHPETANALSNLAAVLVDQGDDRRAVELATRSTVIRRELLGPEHPDLGVALNTLAEAQLSLGHTELAIRTHREALASFERAVGRDSPWVAMSLGNLAACHWRSGELEHATSCLERAERIEERWLQALMQAGSEQQKRAYLAKREGDQDLVVSFALHTRTKRAEELAALVVLRRKARVLDAIRAGISWRAKSAPPALRRKVRELASIRAQIASAGMAGPGTLSTQQHARNLSLLNERAIELEREIGDTPTDKTQSNVTRVAAIASILPIDAALIEFVRFESFEPRAKVSKRWDGSRYGAFVLRRTGALRWFDLGDAKAIEEAAGALRSAAARPDHDVDRPARALYRLVLAPLESAVGDATTIFIAPDAMLHLVPFAALRDRSGTDYVENHTINVLSSGRELLRFGTQAPAREPAIVIGDPVLRSGGPAEGTGMPALARLGRLPHAADEARRVAGQLDGARLLLGASATEHSLKQVHGPVVVHAATHGFYVGPGRRTRRTRGLQLDLGAGRRTWWEDLDPMVRSGIVLSRSSPGSDSDDGFLTAIEALDLDLLGTRLVVLSACETGVGTTSAGEGVDGLRRALTLAGVETSVMTLWSIDDESTRDLMTDYYLRLRAGGGRVEALRQAQLALRARSRTRHPYYWAAFIASGNPRSLNESPPARVAASVPAPRHGGCACESGGGSLQGSARGALVMLVSIVGLLLRRGRSRSRRACVSHRRVLARVPGGLLAVSGACFRQGAPTKRKLAQW